MSLSNCEHDAGWPCGGSRHACRHGVGALFLWAPIACLLLTTSLLPAAEPEATATDLPRRPATPPENALSTFQIKTGFRMDLVAAEPLVVDPIAMAFDEDGRLFVIEMRDYAEQRNETPHLGRVRMLEDTDGDGHFDKSTVYLDNLPWPTAITCWNGGLFVGATPDIIYCKDTHHDGVADVREVVFTGFASDYAPYETTRLNVQQLCNSFTWGPDNRIHGASGGNAGKVISTRHPESPAVDLRGHDFSFDPRALTIRAESGGGQYGMSFDSRGRKFVCSNSAHLRQVMYEDRYAARNPYFGMPPVALDIPVDGPAAPVYRLSPDEPWRILRTQWRVAGKVPGPIEGGGRPSGYFTGATGLMIYRGDAFPEEFHDNAFVGECSGNLVHRKVLLPNGVPLKAERPADEQKVEFLASRDNWFRPVQMANAPDGTLYIADMYREVVEHPWSLPESMKKWLHLESGNRGRIYRILPQGFRQRQPPRLGRLTTPQLVDLLEHTNGWHRDTAARLLCERQDNAAVPHLEAMALNSLRSPAGRVLALQVLRSLGDLTEAHLLGPLNDHSPLVRERAIRLAEEFVVQPVVSPALWARLASLASDPDLLVRYQLAFTLGETRHPGRFKLLETIIRHDASDRWLRAAVLSSLAHGANVLFEVLTADVRFLRMPGGEEFLAQLAKVTGASDRPNDIRLVLGFLARNPNASAAFALARSLGEGLQQAGSSLTAADSAGALQPLFARASLIAPDPRQAAATRIDAIEMLGLSGSPRDGGVLLALLDRRDSSEIESAALVGLLHFPGTEASAELIKRWRELLPEARPEVLGSLLIRPERIALLLSAIEAREIQPADLSAAQAQALRGHRDPAIRARAATVLGQLSGGQRADVVKTFLPVLQLRGEAAKGQAIFLERCSICHRLHGQGFSVGPDLATAKTAGKEKLLISILDPNREVAPGYVNYTVETKSGDTFSGLIAQETSAAIILRGPSAAENTVLRSQIESLQSSSQSLMPEGLEAGLTSQALADLLEFIEADTP